MGLAEIVAISLCLNVMCPEDNSTVTVSTGRFL